MMKLVLEQELVLSPQWLEDQSNTTQENAIPSAEMLKKMSLKVSIYGLIFCICHEQSPFLKKRVLSKKQPSHLRIFIPVA